jgi:branched-chain amino acid transport system substrate-binding protein
MMNKWIFGAALAVWFGGSFAAGATGSQDLVIGQVAPFSGPQGVTGLAINAGVQLYFDAVNARGGVHGRRLKLVSKDDEQKPAETVKLTREIVAEYAPLSMIGTVSTNNLEAVATDGVLRQSGTAMVGAVSGAASVIHSSGMYVVKASYHDEIDRLFKQIASFGQKQVAVLYQEDSFGQDVLSGAEASAKKYGVELVARAGYARNTIAVEHAVAELNKASPQVILVGAVTASAIEFVKQYRAAKGSATLYGLSFIDAEAMLKKLGPETVRGYAFSVVLPMQQQSERSIIREYLQLRAGSHDPNFSPRSIEGFIAAKMLVKVLEGLPNPTPQAVSEALAHARFDLGDYPVDFTTRGKPGSNYVDFAMFGSQGRIVQ